MFILFRLWNEVPPKRNLTDEMIVPPQCTFVGEHALLYPHAAHKSSCNLSFGLRVAISRYVCV